MPPKKNRADRKTIAKIFKQGVFVNSPVFSFKYFFLKNNPKSKVSFVVPKGVAKLATRRNKLRRDGYAALKKQTVEIPPGTQGVFVFKKAEDKISVLKNEIETILHKIY